MEKSKDIIFPEKSPEIITPFWRKMAWKKQTMIFGRNSRRAKKPMEKFWRIWLRGPGRKIFLSWNCFRVEIGNEFNSKTAEQIAKELKEQIIDLAVPAEPEISSSFVAPEKSSNRKGKDSYREAIE